MFQEYYSKGISVIPEQNGIPLKGVEFSKWYRDNYRPSQEVLTEWDNLKNTGIALLTGSPSNIIALDIDEATEEQQAKIIKLAGDSPVKKFGTKGVTLFYKFNGEENKPFVKDKKMIVELLSTGRKTTIPPSTHREKKEVQYKWLNKPLLEHYNELPVINKNIVTLLDEYLIIKRTPPVEYKYDRILPTPELNDAEALLNDYCNPDCDRFEWISIGSCLRSCFGDSAFYVFNDWSAKSKKYNKKEINSVWRSFQGSYNYGVLVNVAKKYGYTPVITNSSDTINFVNIAKWEKEKLRKKAEKLKEAETTDNDLIETAPPLIKELTQWICRTAMYPQPMLSLGAVICALGFIMGRKYILGESTRSNVFCVAMAGSQEGKEHIVNAVRIILNSCEMDKFMERTWSSGSAIESALGANEHEVIYCTDEMGIIMKGLTGKFQNVNQSEAYAALLQLSVTNYYKGKSYTDRQARPALISYYPNTAVFGSTQPELFFNAMSNEQAISGFLNRLLIFQAPFNRPQNNNRNRLLYKDEINTLPVALKQNINRIKDNYDRFVQSHRLTRENLQKHILKPVQYTPEVEELKQNLIDDIDRKFNEFKNAGSKMHLIIGRSVELIDKVALIASQGQDIDINHWHWSQKLVEHSIGIMCQASTELISENDWERDLNKVMMYVRQNQIVSKSDLTTRFRKLNSIELDKMILKLQDMDEVLIAFDKSGLRRKTVYISLKNKPDNFESFLEK